MQQCCKNIFLCFDCGIVKSLYICVTKANKMNTTLTQLKKYAKSIGAEIEVNELLDYANIQAVAPDGKIWAESGGVSLVNWYGYENKQDKQDAYNDLMERMRLGLEDETATN